eukprot:g33593.t1
MAWHVHGIELVVKKSLRTGADGMRFSFSQLLKLFSFIALGCYALLVKHWDPELDFRVMSYKVSSSPSGYYINPRVKFISLPELVKYYH